MQYFSIVTNESERVKTWWKGCWFFIIVFAFKANSFKALIGVLKQASEFHICS